MKKIKFFLSLMLSLVAVLANAQNIDIHGTVTDAATGEGIPAVAVQVKGTTHGVMADADGQYTIKAPQNCVLVFTALGYNVVEVSTKGRTGHMNIILEPDAKMLDETIVVAYGATKKSSFVGSATQLSGDKLATTQSTNITKGLEGAIAGLQIASSNGSPGSGASIQIRGFGSISASTNPLIVVDGTPYEGSLNSIPQVDIESLTVLKDAAANSMYGARGSNGVILITTRRGNSSKVHVSLDAKWGVNSRAIPDYETVSNPGDYYELLWEAHRNSVYYNGTMDLAQAGLYASGYLAQSVGGYNIYKGIADDQIIDPTTGKLNANAKELKWNDNWSELCFRPGLRQEYNLSASGGSENTQGYFSVTYLDDAGYVANSGFKRLTVRGKVDHQFRNWLKAGVNISYANTNKKVYNDSESNNFANLFMTINQIPPIYPVYQYDLATGEPVYDKDGNKAYDWGTAGRPFGANGNAYGQLVTSDYNTIIDNVSSRAYLNATLYKDLVFSANVAFDVFNTKDNSYMTPLGGDALNVNGRGYQTMQRYFALNTNQLLTWSPKFGKNNINLMVGHEIKKDQSYYMEGHMTNFVDPNVSDFANAVVYQNLTSATGEYFLQGVFGRFEWNYDDRYYASASVRGDGSSRFAKDKRWGAFWAVGAGWNISNESFLQNVPQINFLKLKASYGTQGNDNIGYTKVYEDLYRIDRVDGQAALTKVFRAAPEVTWEKSNNFNVGFESKFFDILSLNVEYFIKDTKDMIYRRPLASSQGSPSFQLVNDIDMRNSGVEFELNLNLLRKKNVTWDFNLNGTHYKNKILRLPSDYPTYGKQVGNAWREVGQPLYNYYLKEYAGVDPATGQALFNVYETDAETGLSTGVFKETTTSSTDATYVKTGKTPIPDIYGGFGTSLKFYGFDFNASFAYQYGGYTLDSVYQGLMNAGNLNSNWHKDIFNRWTPQNTNTDVPRVQLGGQQANATSTRFLISSSYISLRFVTLGYTLPKKWTNAINMKGIRIYVQGENLWYLSARKGMDVRKSFSGDTGNTYSALRTISGGINVTF